MQARPGRGTAPRAAGCTVRSCNSRDRGGPDRTRTVSRSTSQGVAITSQREKREAVAIHVVAEHEARGQLAALSDPRAALLADAVAGEPAAGVRLLVPAS